MSRYAREYTPDSWKVTIEPVPTRQEKPVASPPKVPDALLEPRLLPVAELHKRLTLLKPACDEVLELLKRRARQDADKQGVVPSRACVNWADLRCKRAEIYLDDEGHAGYRVLVEEAAPENATFQIAVTQELEARGFSDVYVETAW